MKKSGMKKIVWKSMKGWLRVKALAYKHLLSTADTTACRGKLCTPALFLGEGQIRIEKDARLGFLPSPLALCSYHHIEARSANSSVFIDSGTIINNGSVIASDGAPIHIGKNCLIGPGLEVYSSDFHNLDPTLRHTPGAAAEVVIGDNVFIGARVMILKGVTIGENSVIGAGSVVVKSCPANTIMAGNPAKIIGQVPENKSV